MISTPLVRLIIIGGLALGSIACSSVPDFKPSVPVAKASSFSEALDTCSSYQISFKPEEKVRISAVVPWIQCLEDVSRYFPQSRSDRGFLVFLRALKGFHDYRSPSQDKIDNPDRLNRIVLHVLENLKSASLQYSDDEYGFIRKEFPRYAEYLEEKGFFKGPQPRESQLREDLGVLSEDVISTKSIRTQNNRVFSSVQKKYCREYLGQLNRVARLKELLEYQDILTQRDSGADTAMVRRVAERVKDLKAESLSQHEKLQSQLQAIHAKTSWFQNELCLTPNSF